LFEVHNKNKTTMTEKQAQNLEAKVARLEVHMEYQKENAEETKNDLTKILLAINRSNDEREADIISLKVSIKNKINDSVKPLNTDLNKIKEETWIVSWFYNHKKTFITLVAIFMFTFIDRLITLYNYTNAKFFG
jgi:hypothetical protein